MKSLTILTTNPEKQAQARAAFESSTIQLEFTELETPEIQAFTCEEVANASAIFAFELLKKPLAVTDAGFFIPSLKGFPGPFLKYINKMLTADEILRLMEGKADRTINLSETVTYIDTDNAPHSFTSVIKGQLATECSGEGRIFDQLFIPEGLSETAERLGLERMHQLYVERFTHWHELRRYLESIT